MHCGGATRGRVVYAQVLVFNTGGTFRISVKPLGRVAALQVPQRAALQHGFVRRRWVEFHACVVEMSQPICCDFLKAELAEGGVGREDVSYDDLSLHRFAYERSEVTSRQWNEASQEWLLI